MEQHFHTSYELWVCSIPFQSCILQLEWNSSSSWWDGEGLNVWKSGAWSERAGLLSGGNKYCRHQWEMIHLFNVPFPKWNPCNPTDMATSPCISPLWNLIRAKTVYQCLAPDIYWKWPFVKVIAKAWKGFVMRPWSFSIVCATKTRTRCVNSAIYQLHQLRKQAASEDSTFKHLDVCKPVVQQI